MDLNKLTMGDRIIAISGIVLFIFSFFDWFAAEFNGETIDAGNAWDFNLSLLAVLIGIAMVVIVALKAFGVALAPSAPWGTILLVMGVVAFAFVLIKLIAGVDVDAGPFDVDVKRKIGIFVGLIASAGLAVGGYFNFQESKGASPAPPAAPPTA
jgi:hypothetical protein